MPSLASLTYSAFRTFPLLSLYPTVTEEVSNTLSLYPTVTEEFLFYYISGARRNSRVRPVYAHSSPRTVRGRAGTYMDLDETMIHTSLILPSDPSRVLLHSSLFLLPSTSTSRFELPFVILALVVASPPVPLRTPTVRSLHCLLRVLGGCAFTLLLFICSPHAPLFRPHIPTVPYSFPLLFGLYLQACMTPTPSLHRALRRLQRHIFLHHHHLRPQRAPSAAQPHQHRDATHEAALKPKPSTTRSTTRGPYTTMEVGSCFVGASGSLPVFSSLVFPIAGMRNCGGPLFLAFRKAADTEVVRRVPAPAFGCAHVAPAILDMLYPLCGHPVSDVGDVVGILSLLREGGGVAL
ncbi:hypothetical protein K438DRAFT_1989822 [Mycena galopus ATCC 62051]|nr:hypothetical protein K438DRAFT_1989822 [Mycena galopus ATCC 62051]